MISLGSVINLLIMAGFIMAVPIGLILMVRIRSRGKHLGFILEKDKPLSIKLLKVIGGEMVRDGDDEWFLSPKFIRPTDYPVLWPKALSMFQIPVESSLLVRGKATNVDWEDPNVPGYSSKELTEALDPHWLAHLIKGVIQEGGGGKKEKILTYLTLGLGAICLIMIFFLITKIGGLEQAIKLIR